MTTAKATPAGRAGEGQQGTSRMFYLFVGSHGQPIVSLPVPVPRPCSPDCSSARPWDGKAPFPFGERALPSQAPPCAAFPAGSLAPRPRAHPLRGAAFGIKDFFPSTKSVFQSRVVFLLEKDPTRPTQIVILGHVLHRIPIFLSLDTLLPWDLFLKHSPKEKHLC